MRQSAAGGLLELLSFDLPRKHNKLQAEQQLWKTVNSRDAT